MKRKQIAAVIAAAGILSNAVPGGSRVLAQEEVMSECENDEAETEIAQKPDQEQVTEAESKKAAEMEESVPTSAASGAESEVKTEAETETETKMETESETASEQASEVESESESAPHWVCRITGVEPNGERIYDGTDLIELSWQVETEYVGGELPEGEIWPDNAVSCTANLDSPDAGERKACYIFALTDQAPEGAVLENGQGEIVVEIKPRPLTVTLPNGWKFYHDEGKLSNIHLEGKVKVEGWLRDETGKEQIPNGYRAPKITVNEKVLNRNTPIYKEEKDKTARKDEQELNRVKQALVMDRKKDGSLDADPGSENYRFDEEHTEGGEVTIREAAVIRGRDYQIEAPAGMSYEDSHGVWWLRPGTGLSLRPMENSGYTDAHWTKEGQGILLRYRKGELLARSLPFPVTRYEDASAPAYSLDVTGGDLQDGICYVQSSAEVTLLRPQDTESGVEKAEYILEKNGTQSEKGDFSQGASITIGGEEGEYRVSARAVDHVGNEKRLQSRLICVDKTPPVITVRGVEEQDNVRGKVNVRIRIDDDHLDRQSIAATLTGKYTGAVMHGKMHFRKGYSFIDFPYLGQAEDDQYTLQVLTQDKAGNRTSRTMTFTLNREGAVYAVGEETQKALAWYWHKEAFPVIMQETNRSVVKRARLLSICSGKTKIIREEGGLQIRRVKQKDGKMRITYSAPAELFAEEGEYEVILLTEDAAGGKSDSLAQKIAVRFGIDRSAPTGIVTGIRAKQIVRGEYGLLCVQVQDNLALNGLRICVDGKPVVEKGEKELADNGGVVKYRIGAAKHWQHITAAAWDKAGNIWKQEIPVYVGGGEYVPSYLWERGLFRWIRRLLRLLGEIIKNQRI